MEKSFFNMKFPNNKNFVFTIIDDTDDTFLENIKPVYDILYENNIITTKTVWVYPPRDKDESKGDCLQNKGYLEFVKDLSIKGYEIGLHNVGSGGYNRKEIIEGLKEFKEKLGFYPNIHINHSYNKDNIYSGSKRFSFPLNYVVKKLYSKYDDFEGDIPGSAYFWGDLHKKHIKYARNLEIDDLNTLKRFPYMPYKDKQYEKYSNYWFASTFAPNQWLFNKKVTKNSIDRLEKENGVCILYTHLGYYTQKGEVDRGFTEMIKYIGAKKSGWFVPVSTLLDYLLKNNSNIEIFAYGAGGYGSLQEYMILDKYIDEIDPDIILWQFCDNDFINNDHELESRSILNGALDPRPYYVNDKIKVMKPWRRHGIIYDFLHRLYFVQLASLEIRILEKDNLVTIEKELTQEHPLYLNSVHTTEKIMKLCKNRIGNKPLITFNAKMYDEFPGWWSDAFEKIAMKNNFIFLSQITDSLTTARDSGIKIDGTPKNEHWNSTGHAIVGKLLLNYLISNKLIKSKN